MLKFKIATALTTSFEVENESETFTDNEFYDQYIGNNKYKLTRISKKPIEQLMKDAGFYLNQRNVQINSADL